MDEPFDRTTNLSSLDLSYDVGFATVSATSSYYTTDGSLIQDSTFDYAASPAATTCRTTLGFRPTRVGSIHSCLPIRPTPSRRKCGWCPKPTPRTCSTTSWVPFMRNQTNKGNWFVTTPGSPERSMAQGCTGPVFYTATGPSSFPNCLVVTGPDDTTFQQLDKQTFTDKSVFGELTWHFMSHGQITGGMRHFRQDFTDEQLYQDYTFNIVVPPTPHEAPASKTVGKFDVSYEYSAHQYAYALWSQGFRRGGANSLPPPGNILAESPLLKTYQPDSTNNYEAGLKGRLDNGLSYAFAGFLIPLGQATDLFKPAIRESGRLQRQYGRVVGLRIRIHRSLICTAPDLLDRFRLRRRLLDQSVLLSGQ